MDQSNIKEPPQLNCQFCDAMMRAERFVSIHRKVFKYSKKTGGHQSLLRYVCLTGTVNGFCPVSAYKEHSSKLGLTDDVKYNERNHHKDQSKIVLIERAGMNTS